MFAVLLVLLLVTGCGSPGGAVPGKIEADPGGTPWIGQPTASWQFGWQVPSQVEITERMFRLDHTVRRRYVAYLVASPNDENLLLKFADLEILSVDGAKATTNMDRASAFLATMDVLPTFVITPNGDLLRFEGGAEATQQALLAVRRYSPDLDEESLMFLEEMTRSEQLVDLSCLRAMDMWWAWVGAWVELGLASGDVLEGDMPMGDGNLTMPFRVRHHGPSPYGPGMARLSYYATASGERWQIHLIDQLSLFYSLLGLDNEMFALIVDNMEFQQNTLVSLVLFPETLRPVWVFHRMETEMTLADYHHVVVRESEYTFRWLQEQVSARRHP